MGAAGVQRQIGFLVAWNMWLFIMLYVAVIGLVLNISRVCDAFAGVDGG